jgi:hypothetical protein
VGRDERAEEAEMTVILTNRSRPWRTALLQAVLEWCADGRVAPVRVTMATVRRRNHYLGRAWTKRNQRIKVYLHRRFSGAFPMALLDPRVPELHDWLRVRPVHSRAELLVWIVGHELHHLVDETAANPPRRGEPGFAAMERRCDLAGFGLVQRWRASRHWPELLAACRSDRRARLAAKVAESNKNMMRTVRANGGLAALYAKMREQQR